VNLNTEQAQALANLINKRPAGPLSLEGGPGGVRFVTFGSDGDRLKIDLFGHATEEAADATATALLRHATASRAAGDQAGERAARAALAAAGVDPYTGRKS
jgi:hypothetical protein